MRYSDCEYLGDTNQCSIATALATIPAFVLDDKACRVCQKQECPKAPNMVTASLALAAIRKYKPELHTIIFAKLQQYFPSVQEGPGTELSRLLKEHGYEPTAGCDCFSMMNEMNTNGYDWCVQNTKAIANVMVHEWKTRHWILARIIPEKVLKNNKTGAVSLITQALARWSAKAATRVPTHGAQQR